MIMEQLHETEAALTITPGTYHASGCVVIYIIRITMIMIMRMMKKIISNEGSNI